MKMTFSPQYRFFYKHFTKYMDRCTKQFPDQRTPVRAFAGEQTDSAVPLINLLELLTVNNVYRLHALRFTYLWHKNLLPNVFYNIFKYASSIHTYNTRYAASQNLYKTRVRTNTGKQTISYMASIVWLNIPPYMKNLNVYQFSKQIKLYLFSEQLENS